MTLAESDIESLERATLQAVAPEQVHELPGWLLPMDSGTVGRAKSAVPWTREAADPAAADRIAQAYRANGFQPVLRVPDLPAFDALRSHLLALGFTHDQPTLTQVGRIDKVIAALSHLGTEGVALDERPDAAWMAMFLGEGFDPVDGASRAASLARAQGTRFVSLRMGLGGGQTLACAAASFGHGWLGLHGLRTEARQRGRGLAGKVLLAMALEARARGVKRMYLQVHESSTSALALYRRVGLETVWSYHYWRP
ncbi:GNAT family N-acetyltransferase [Hydrogenophaga sp.]|uniref:GNAT family N-acetyltransferase n=1 Tax=Hydrogenophaga sp. TaxID=1904254 RepID=UPI00356A7285